MGQSARVAVTVERVLDCGCPGLPGSYLDSCWSLMVRCIAVSLCCVVSHAGADGWG